MTYKQKIRSKQEGAMVVMAGLSFLVFLGFVALAADIGFILVTRNQLQNAADAAALAATRKLGDIYTGLAANGYANYTLSSTDKTLITNAAQNVGAQNNAAGQALTIASSDVRIGRWNSLTRAFTVTDLEADAVEVTARRDATANGPISTFFAKIMGVNSVDVTSSFLRSGGMWKAGERPLAALSGVTEAAPGELNLPVGIADSWFQPGSGFCGNNIQFYPTPTSCAGWHTFQERPANAATLRKKILQKMPPFGSYQAPGSSIGDTMEFIGGNVSSALPDLKALFDALKVWNPSAMPPRWEWKTYVVVYKEPSCLTGSQNPGGALEIVGYATVTITNVLEPPDGQLIEGSLDCRALPNVRGGGGEYGTVGEIPGLVQ